MTNYAMHENAVAALKVFEDCKLIVHMTWAFAAWLDIEHDGTEEEYLARLDRARILSAVGYKRLKALKAKHGKTEVRK